MEPVIEKVLEGFVLGEGPHWDKASENLYFVDILEKNVHRFDPKTKKHFKASIDEDSVSFIIPIEGKKDEYLISVGTKICRISWDGISKKVSKLETVTELKTSPHLVQFNDAKADPSGRVWLGTIPKVLPSLDFPKERGAFYSFDGKQLKEHFDKVDVSNGLAWDLELGKMYYADSGKKTISQFDFDEKTGTISNRQTVFDFDENDVPGIPDGLTIDSDGNLWVACFNGYRVIKIYPRKKGTLLRTLEMPAAQVTSVQFGGKNLDELYVTTGQVPIEGVEFDPSVDGVLYKVLNLGAKGGPVFNVKLM